MATVNPLRCEITCSSRGWGEWIKLNKRFIVFVCTFSHFHVFIHCEFFKTIYYIKIIYLKFRVYIQVLEREDLHVWWKFNLLSFMHELCMSIALYLNGFCVRWGRVSGGDEGKRWSGSRPLFQFCLVSRRDCLKSSQGSVQGSSVALKTKMLSILKHLRTYRFEKRGKYEKPRKIYT